MFTGRSTVNEIKLETISGAPVLGLDRLVAEWPFKPHRWRRDASARALTRLATNRLNALLAAGETRAWGLRCGDALQALIVLRLLEWDSRELEMSAARIELVTSEAGYKPRVVIDALVTAALEKARQLQVQHVSARVDAADGAAIQALESHGFQNVDVLLTFGAPIDDLHAELVPADIVLRNGAVTDREVIGEIAAASFRYGRFHADPAIRTEQAQRVYRSWAIACCEGRAANHVIVATIDERPVGFVACSIDADTAAHLPRPTGTITLIASAESVRGRGVGAALVAASLEWFRGRDVATVEVGTQLRNAAAARLYERCGFRLVGGALSFRAVIESCH